MTAEKKLNFSAHGITLLTDGAREMHSDSVGQSRCRRFDRLSTDGALAKPTLAIMATTVPTVSTVC
jgi:hypothetical protein